MRYAGARAKEDAIADAYREYTTETLRMITENTSRFAGGPYLKLHFSELTQPRKRETRSGEEIAADVIARAGLTVIQGGADK